MRRALWILWNSELVVASQNLSRQVHLYHMIIVADIDAWFSKDVDAALRVASVGYLNRVNVITQLSSHAQCSFP